MENAAMGKRFNPERYGMIYCPACKGAGKFFKGVEERLVCQNCGGFGLIKKEEGNNFDGPTVHS